jgi:DNA-directed RNA polymerase subunit RPC12/RpoP
MYKCKKCSAEYKTKVGLIKHKNKHHSEEKKNYLCSYCEQEFSHYQNRWCVTRKTNATALR